MKSGIRAILVSSEVIFRDKFSLREVPELFSGIPGDVIATLAYSDFIYHGALTGSFTHQEWTQKLATYLALEFPEKNCVEAVRQWSQARGRLELDNELYDFAKGLLPNKYLGIATNETTAFRAEMEKADVVSHFKHCFISCEIGHVKPEKKFYQHLVRKLSLDAAQILLLEGTEGAVRVAEYYGFPAVRCQSVSQLKRDLAKLL